MWSRPIVGHVYSLLLLIGYNLILLVLKDSHFVHFIKLELRMSTESSAASTGSINLDSKPKVILSKGKHSEWKAGIEATAQTAGTAVKDFMVSSKIPFKHPLSEYAKATVAPFAFAGTVMPMKIDIYDLAVLKPPSLAWVDPSINGGNANGGGAAAAGTPGGGDAADPNAATIGVVAVAIIANPTARLDAANPPNRHEVWVLKAEFNHLFDYVAAWENLIGKLVTFINSSLSPADLERMLARPDYKAAVDGLRVDKMWKILNLEFGTKSGLIEEHARMTIGQVDHIVEMINMKPNGKSIPELASEFKKKIDAMVSTGFGIGTKELDVMLALLFLRMITSEYRQEITEGNRLKLFVYDKLSVNYILDLALSWHASRQTTLVLEQPSVTKTSVNAVNVTGKKKGKQGSGKPESGKPGAGEGGKKWKKRKQSEDSNKAPGGTTNQGGGKPSENKPYCVIHQAAGGHNTEDCPDIDPAGRTMIRNRLEAKRKKVNIDALAVRRMPVRSDVVPEVVTSFGAPAAVAGVVHDVMGDRELILTDRDALSEVGGVVSAGALSDGTRTKSAITVRVNAFNARLYKQESAGNPEVMLIGLDSMCGHSITPVRSILHGELNRGICFEIRDYTGEAREVTECGNHPYLGAVIYDPQCHMTLLSKGQARKWFRYVEHDDGVLAVSRLNPSFQIKFFYEEEDPDMQNLLIARVPLDVLAKQRVPINALSATSSEVADGAGTSVCLTRGEYDRLLNVVALHDVMCHIGRAGMVRLVESSSFLQCPVTVRDVENCFKLTGNGCPVCKIGKAHSTSMLPKPSAALRGATNLGATIPSIVPASSLVIEGDSIMAYDLLTVDEKLYAVAIDIRTRFIMIEPLESKGLVQIHQSLKSFLAQYERCKQPLTVVVSDGEPGLLSLDSGLDIFSAKGITLRPCASGDHIGIIERQHRTIRERVNCLLLSLPYVLPSDVLKCAVTHCVDQINLVPREGCTQSPRCLFTGVKDNYFEVIRMRFGQPVFSISKNMSSASNSNGKPGILVGRAKSAIGSAKFYCFETRSITNKSRWIAVDNLDVGSILGENRKYIKVPALPKSLGTLGTYVSRGGEGNTLKRKSDDSEVEEPAVATVKQKVDCVDSQSDVAASVDTPVLADDPAEVGAEAVMDQDEINSSYIEPTRVMPERAARAINWRTRYQVNATVVSPTKTLKWAKALDLHGDNAKVAITKELSQLILEYGAFYPIPPKQKVTRYCNTLDLFDVKSDGSYKARLVMSKDNLGEAADYGVDPYSPTLDLKVLSLMLSLASYYDLELEVWDVKGAFLKAPMVVRDVFVLIRPSIASLMVDIEPEWQEFRRPDGSLMVEVRKAWYGSSSAPALWHRTFTEHLIKAGNYLRHPDIECLFFRELEPQQHKKLFSFLMLHVDDIGALMPKDGVEKRRIKQIIENEFGELKTQSGENVTYIGIQISQVRGSFYLSMSNRIKKLDDEYGVLQGCVSYPVVSPEEFLKPAVVGPGNRLLKKEEAKKYRSLVMTMRYIAMLVKPEILVMCSFLAT